MKKYILVTIGSFFALFIDYYLYEIGIANFYLYMMDGLFGILIITIILSYIIPLYYWVFSKKKIISVFEQCLVLILSPLLYIYMCEIIYYILANLGGGMYVVLLHPMAIAGYFIIPYISELILVIQLDKNKKIT